MSEPLARLTAALADRYRIERELGAGGMATVYLAEDLKHHRKVAIKVLRPELAAVIGAERFLAEIRTTANLQHPHILALIDSGDTDGMLWYVMPYVEGESLRDRITREKQLPIADAVRIATEVAGALDYAHRHKVIHRDIKPENILLHDGAALVADFGIALAASSGAGTRMTETGMSLGTPHYMSPEQAMGEREITARSRRLRARLHHLRNAGRRAAVQRPDRAGNHRAGDDRGAAGAHHPAQVRAAGSRGGGLHRAREAPGRPLCHGGGIRCCAGRSAERPAAATAVPAASGAPRRPRFLWPVTAVLLGAVALWGWLRPGPVLAPQPAARGVLACSVLGFPESQRRDGSSPASPSRLMVSTSSSPTRLGDDTQLFLKRRNESRATPIAGTEGGAGPFFSPDGQWIGYFVHGGILRKVRVSGGGSIQLAGAGNTTYEVGAWLDDGTIAFTDNSGGMSRVSGDGGPVTSLRAPRMDHRDDPSAITPLPGGRGVVFTGCPGNCASASAVYAYDIKRDTTVLLVPNAAGGWYSPTGHLLYVSRTGGLFAAGFDLKQMKITSGAVSVADSVAPNGLALSASGTALLVLGTEDFDKSTLVWVSRDGTEEPIATDWTGYFEYPALAPDGKTIAVSVRNAVTQLWVRRADGSRIRVTHKDLGSWRPNFTPDGRNFAFITASGATTDSGATDAYLSPTDGSTPPQLLLNIKPGIWEAEFSRDGKWLVFRTDDASSYGVFYARRLHGDTTLSMIYSDSSFQYPACPLARQQVAGVHVRPLGAFRGLRGVVPRHAGQVSRITGRRHRTPVGAQRARTPLQEPGQADEPPGLAGRGVFAGERPSALLDRGVCRRHQSAAVRCIARRSPLPDDPPARRARRSRMWCWWSTSSRTSRRR